MTELPTVIYLRHRHSTYNDHVQAIPAKLVGHSKEHRTRSHIVTLYYDDEGRLTIRHMRAVDNKNIITLEQWRKKRGNGV